MRRVWAILWTLVAGVGLSGCAGSGGNGWPSLAEGFGTAPAKTAQTQQTTPPAAEVPGPTHADVVPANKRSVDRKRRAIAARLAQFDAEFAADRRTIDNLDGAYEVAMTALRNSRTPDDWNGAQIALTRFNAKVDDLAALNSRLAQTLARAAALLARVRRAGNGAAPSAPAPSTPALTGLVVRGGDLYGRIGRTRRAETIVSLARASELTLLRPGPKAARTRQTMLADFAARQPLLTVRFETPSPAFEAGLAKVVGAARAQVPDVRFDLLVTHAPADADRAETALRTVLGALLALDAAPRRVVRRSDAGARAPIVQLYVR